MGVKLPDSRSQGKGRRRPSAAAPAPHSSATPFPGSQAADSSTRKTLKSARASNRPAGVRFPSSRNEPPLLHERHEQALSDRRDVDAFHCFIYKNVESGRGERRTADNLEWVRSALQRTASPRSGFALYFSHLAGDWPNTDVGGRAAFSTFPRTAVFSCRLAAPNQGEIPSGLPSSAPWIALRGLWKRARLKGSNSYGSADFRRSTFLAHRTCSPTLPKFDA